MRCRARYPTRYTQIFMDLKAKILARIAELEEFNLTETNGKNVLINCLLILELQKLLL